MNSPLVSVVIPLYNSEKYISECIESCLRQTYERIEIIVIDDGSTDGGYNIAKKMAREDNRIVVVHTVNKGVSSARNLGIEKSHGDYVCFIDADDKIRSSFINTMMKNVLKEDADFCFSVNVVGDVNPARTSLIDSKKAEALLLSPKVRVGCWNKIYKRSMLDNIRFRQDLFYGEGLYFINQVAHESRRIVVCSDALYDYRKVNPESATTKYDIEKMNNGEKALLEIKKIIKNDGSEVMRAWALHYSLFCINAMRGILRNNKSTAQCRVWKRKLTSSYKSALLSGGSLRFKIGIIIGRFSPRMLYLIKK